VRKLSTVVLLSVLMCGGSGAAYASDHVSDIPIKNFDQVTPTLWRGAKPDEEGLKWLAQHDVKTVVDLRAICTKEEQQLAQAHGLQYIRIPLGFTAPDDNSVESFLALAQSAKQPVFVHCREGEDRTGTLIGVYRMVVQRWSFNRVYADMRDHGFKPWFFGLKRTVKYACKKFGI
jgi:tyrosine-protein phosphatase SIW14